MTSPMRNATSKLCNAVTAPVATTRDALAERLQGVCEIASLLYNRPMDNIHYGQERLKDIVEKEARKEEEEPTEQTEDNIDLTARENERVLKGVYRSFLIPRHQKQT